MQLNQESLLTNVFPLWLIFDKPLEGVDFFEAKGIFPRTEKYHRLGDVVYQLELAEKTAFAKYSKSKEEDFVIGFLAEELRKKQYIMNGISVTYVGKQSLAPTEEGKRALLELIYILKWLKQKGYIEPFLIRKKKHWRLTDKGLRFLRGLV